MEVSNGVREISFIKMVASGNDFVVMETRSRHNLARQICNRKFGVGADGLLLLEKSRVADIKMRIFNPDGSEAQMCGNGARCVALWLSSRLPASSSQLLKIQTKAGLINAQVRKDKVKIKLTEPKDIKLDIPIEVNQRKIRVNFINTGVPHVVVFSQGLDKMNILGLARFIRYHRKFAPQGTNVNFVEVLNKDSLKIRTYERGVEDETLACGTGSVASALIFSLKGGVGNKIKLYTRSREVLKVSFLKEANTFGDVWLEGKAEEIYKGAYHV